MENKVLKSLADEFSDIHLKSFNQQNLRFSSRFIFSLLINPQISYIYKKNKGFCIFSFYKEEAEIITMAILPEYQNQGVGLLILQELEQILINANCSKIFLEVASNNLIALHLYKKVGFRNFGIRKNYYKILKDKKVDAILMKKVVNLQK